MKTNIPNATLLAQHPIMYPFHKEPTLFATSDVSTKSVKTCWASVSTKHFEFMTEESSAWNESGGIVRMAIRSIMPPIIQITPACPLFSPQVYFRMAIPSKSMIVMMKLVVALRELCKLSAPSRKVCNIICQTWG